MVSKKQMLLAWWQRLKLRDINKKVILNKTKELVACEKLNDV